MGKRRVLYPQSFRKDNLRHCANGWKTYEGLCKELKRTEVKPVSQSVGMGLFAKEVIPEGSIVVECTGSRIDKSVIEIGEDDFNFDRDNHEYMIRTFGGQTAIDASMSGATHVWKFINHACDPNCKYFTINLAEDELSVKDPIEVVFVYALRTIQIGEELTCSYDWPLSKRLPRESCKCGCINCSDWIGVCGYPRVEEEVIDGGGMSGDPIGSKSIYNFKTYRCSVQND